MQRLLVRWNNSNDELNFSIPAANKNISIFIYLSFGVSQKESSSFNAANQIQKIRVALKDGINNERAVRISAFLSIPYSDQRAQVWTYYIKLEIMLRDLELI